MARSQAPVKHPAPYSQAVLDAFERIFKTEQRIQSNYDGRAFSKLRVLDPFAGIGLIHRFRPIYETWGMEIEPEWAERGGKFTKIGDSREIERRFKTPFHVVCSSPCLAQEHRLLTNDLQWVSAGDIQVGDELLSFEEHRREGTTGCQARRRWERATVIRSKPRKVQCVRVVLANGDEIVTTPNHPWLANRYSHSSLPAEWVPSINLMGSPGIGTTKGRRRGERQPWFVYLQVRPWEQRTSFDAGWLSGLFDGEGSLSMGAHGAPKMTLCQVDGPVLDRAERLMTEFGYEPNRIWRINNPEGRQKIGNLYVTGGFPGLLRALGELRPTRLLTKWESLDPSLRSVEAEKIAVVAVEPAGRVDIQEIETSSGTYIGEGYLHHNCYGNRMADHHNARDGSHRRSYKHYLGRDPHEASAATLLFGPNYKLLHEDVIEACYRLLLPGGIFVWNTKNSIVTKGGKVVEIRRVTEWFARLFCELGLLAEHLIDVETPGYRFGVNRDLRMPSEKVMVFRKPFD